MARDMAMTVDVENTFYGTYVTHSMEHGMAMKVDGLFWSRDSDMI